MSRNTFSDENGVEYVVDNNGTKIYKGDVIVHRDLKPDEISLINYYRVRKFWFGSIYVTWLINKEELETPFDPKMFVKVDEKEIKY